MPANLARGVHRDEGADYDVRSLELAQDRRIVVHRSVGNRVAEPPCRAVSGTTGSDRIGRTDGRDAPSVTVVMI